MEISGGWGGGGGTKLRTFAQVSLKWPWKTALPRLSQKHFLLGTIKHYFLLFKNKND